MSDYVPNFWPEDIAIESITTPLSILKREAAYLGEKTGQLVTADVSTSRSSEGFVHFFRLVAPVLDNYQYELFRVHHDITLYPLTIVHKNKGLVAASQEELLKWIATIVQEPETKVLVHALLAQSKV